MTDFTANLKMVMNAHSLGYWDGRAHGVCERCLDDFNDDELLAYRFGFDKGVADYSELDAVQDEAAA